MGLDEIQPPEVSPEPMTVVRRSFTSGNFLVASFLTLLVSCSSPSVPRPANSASSVLIGSVVVAVSESVEADRRSRFDAVDGTRRLQGGLAAALAEAGKFRPDGSLVLRAEVVKFRLRSTGAVVGGGMFTGGDFMDVKVDIRDGERVVQEFTTGAGMIGTGFSFSQEKRFAKVIRKLAERVAEQVAIPSA